MRKVNYPNYAGANAPYNDKVKGLVDSIFQTEVNPLTYIAPKRYLPRASKLASHEDSAAPVVRRPKLGELDMGRFNLTDLGDYETSLFSALAWGEGSTYVLAGEMGSGKTATMTYMREIFERRALKPCSVGCAICKPVVIFVGLDDGTRYTATDADVVSAFREDLIKSLYSRIRQIFIDEGLTSQFIDFTKSSVEQRYQCFVPFQTEITMWQLRLGQAFWPLDEDKKCDILLDYVTRLGSHAMQLDALFAMAAYIKAKSRRNSTCVVLLVDNVDRHLEPEKQLGILMLLFGIQHTGIRVLLAMRHTTFRGLPSLATRSFQYIPHLGAQPLAIGLARIRYYLSIYDEWLSDSTLTPHYRKCLRERLEAIAAFLEQKNEFYKMHLAALAGGSIRAGLMQLSRLVVNFTIPFDSGAPSYKNDWVRAAVLGSTADQHFAPDDRYVTNLFANPTRGVFSWVPVLILQLTEGFFSQRSERTATKLEDLIKIMLGSGFREDEFLQGVNHLLQVTRPLVWVDGTYEYKSVDELRKRNDLFHLTRAGHLYLKHLVRDTVFLHESLFSVAWPSRATAPRDVDYSSTVGRSQGSRSLATILLDEDFTHYKRLLEAANASEVLPAIRFGPISVTIISALATAAAETIVKAIGGAAAAFEVRKEAMAWLDLLDGAIQRSRDTGLVVQKELIEARSKIAGTFARADSELRHAAPPERHS